MLLVYFVFGCVVITPYDYRPVHVILDIQIHVIFLGILFTHIILGLNIHSSFFVLSSNLNCMQCF